MTRQPSASDAALVERVLTAASAGATPGELVRACEVKPYVLLLALSRPDVFDFEPGSPSMDAHERLTAALHLIRDRPAPGGGT